MSNDQPSIIHSFDFTQVQESISSVREDIRPLVDAVRTMLDAMRRFQEVTRPIAESFARNKELLATVIKGLSKSGKVLRIIKRLGEAQYVWWDYFTKDLLFEFELSDDTNKTLRKIVSRDKYRIVNVTIEKTIANPAMAKHIRLYTQCVKAFQAGDCDLAVVGFTAVFDGLLSVVSNNPGTSITRRLDIIAKKLETDDVLDHEECALLAFTWTFQDAMEIFSASSDFTKKREPKGLNRHWIAHGRSVRKKTKLDCVKMINMIYGLLLLNSFESTGENEESVGEYV